MTVPIAVRDMREADRPHVTNSWLRSHRSWLCAGIDDVRDMDPVLTRVITAAFYAHYGARAERAMASGSTLMACAPGDDDHIYGWLCHDGAGVVHYCYVKAALRRFGVARSLWRAAGSPLVATHRGRAFEAIAKAIPCTYRPEALT